MPSHRIQPRSPLGESPPRPEPCATRRPALWVLLAFSSVLSALRAWDAGGTRCLCQTNLPATNPEFSRGSAQLSPPFAVRFPTERPQRGSWLGSRARAPRSSIPAGSVRRRQRGCRGDPKPLPVLPAQTQGLNPLAGTFCLCSVTKGAGCLKRRLEKHPGVPREGDAVSYPAEFPFLLRLLFETHRREQPVHSACWKEIDLKVACCMKLLQPRLQH